MRLTRRSRLRSALVLAVLAAALAACDRNARSASAPLTPADHDEEPCMRGGGIAKGRLDPGFGSGGIALVGYGGRFDTGAALVLEPDCSLLVAGSSGDVAPDGSTAKLALLRLGMDGSLDASFGSGGSAGASLGGRDDGGAAVAVQPDGGIVVAGHTAVPGGASFALARFDHTGAIDAGFGAGGHVITTFREGPARASSVAIQPDARIVIAGSLSQVTGLSASSLIAVARYTPDGALDPTFGTGGRVVTAAGSGTSLAAALAIDAAGRIVVAGAAGDGSSSDFLVVRYQPDGALDRTFAGRGWTTTDFGGEDAAAAVVLQSDGRIVLAGRTIGGVNAQGDIVRVGANQSTRIAVARYEPDGRPDTRFGVGGTTAFRAGDRDAAATAVAVQPAGGLVLAGNTEDGPDQDVVVVRLTDTGAFDAAFGSGGAILTDVSGGADRAQALLIEPDGAIVVAGSAYTPNGPTRVAVARYR